MTERTMYRFRFTVRNDRGSIQLITTGYSPQAARRKVCLAENCPEQAIVREEIEDGRRFVLFMGVR